jgi:gas vesicle protein
MKFLWGLLVGFALGVAAGLLLAPQSGEATLAQLNEQGITLRERSEGLGEQLRTRANEALTQGRELYSRTKEELTEQYNKAKTGQI